MAQYNEADVVGIYSYSKIASGERARWDHANFYYYIELNKDSSYLKTEQVGRLTAHFSYEYGAWKIEQEQVILETTHRVLNDGSYHSKSGDKRYDNDPYAEKLDREVYKGRYCLKIVANPYKKGEIRGLEYRFTFYEKKEL